MPRQEQLQDPLPRASHVACMTYGIGIIRFTVTVFIRLNAADGSKTTNKRRPRINAAPNQKNTAFTRGK